MKKNYDDAIADFLLDHEKSIDFLNEPVERQLRFAVKSPEYTTRHHRNHYAVVDFVQKLSSVIGERQDAEKAEALNAQIEQQIAKCKTITENQK